MKSALLLASLALAGSSVAAATPAQCCSIENNILMAMSAYGGAAQATSFCNSYLSGQPKTITTTSTRTVGKRTVTITPSASVSTVVTITEVDVTVTSTIAPSVPASTIITTTTITSVDSATCLSTDAPAAPAKDSDQGSSGSMRKQVEALHARADENHLARRSVAAPGVISSFCACLSLPTPSTTVTVTKTSTVPTLTATASCAGPTTTTAINTITSTFTITTQPSPAVVTQTVTETKVVRTSLPGLAYYAWKNDYNYNGGKIFSAADVTGSNSDGYYQTGLISNFDLLYTADMPFTVGSYQCTLPGQSAQDCSQITLVMQGFFYANQTGTYSIYTGPESDQVTIWAYDEAYSTWTDDNYVATNYDGLGPYLPATDLDVVAGQLVPITIVYVSGYVQGALDLLFERPDGTQTRDTSAFFVPPCADSPFVP